MAKNTRSYCTGQISPLYYFLSGFHEFFFSKSGLVCSSRTHERTDKTRQEVKVSALAIMAFTKTFPENWDSKAPSVGTLLAYLETTA